MSATPSDETSRLEKLLADLPVRAAVLDDTLLADRRHLRTLDAVVVRAGSPGTPTDRAGYLMRQLHRAHPELRIVVLGDIAGDTFERTLAAGADAWLDRRADDAAIAAAVTGTRPRQSSTDRRHRWWRRPR